MNSDFQSYFKAFLSFINGSIIPLMMAIAFIFFLYNAYRYFVAESTSEESRTQARSLAIWGILAFVFILSFWGIVNFFVNGFQLNNNTPTPDYMKMIQK